MTRAEQVAPRPCVVAVIQARTGSTRLPGKVLAEIEGRPLFAWTVAAFRAVPAISTVIIATTVEPGDDALAQAAAAVGPVHRGSARDVLARVWDAAAPYDPDFVVRGTADNPFPDPDVIAGQLARCVDGALDYVGTVGWPLGIAAEVARASALAVAAREAVAPAEREHVMPFLYARPERFRLGMFEPPAPAHHSRYTVDTAEDLELARVLARAIGHQPPVRLAELEAVMAARPELSQLNSGVRQKGWQEVEP
jgi:spore coat polysaccharide biosynthesis protein SpsF